MPLTSLIQVWTKFTTFPHLDWLNGRRSRWTGNHIGTCWNHTFLHVVSRCFKCVPSTYKFFKLHPLVVGPGHPVALLNLPFMQKSGPLGTSKPCGKCCDTDPRVKCLLTQSPYPRRLSGLGDVLGNILLLDFRDMDGYGSIKPPTKHALADQPSKQPDPRLRFPFDMQGKKTTWLKLPTNAFQTLMISVPAAHLQISGVEPTKSIRSNRSHIAKTTWNILST